MSWQLRFLGVAILWMSCLHCDRLAAQDDVADIPSEDVRIGKDDNQRYFLVGPPKDAKAPEKGYGLLIVLPGGDGSAEFQPFVKRIYKHAVPAGYVLAQPVAAKWSDKQEIVWPTDKNHVDGMKFTTEDLVDAVIKDVGGKHKLDPTRTFTLTWSSSGSAAYAVSLTNKKVTGSFIAMSVFKPDLLPKLDAAKGGTYYLYHSPDDRVCPFWMAKKAAEELDAAGATVKLEEYDGGHGWRGDLFGNIQAGIEWLEKNRAAR